MSRVFMLALALLTCVARASAHGSSVGAAELLTENGGSATLVRLTPGGLAFRVPDGFRYVCPEAWGGDVLAPAAAIPAGPALIASDGLFVVEQNGRVSPHPIQSGAGVVVTNNREAVFGVFKHDGKYELRRVTRTSNDLVRTLDQPFGALVANDRELSLLRWLDGTLVLQRMSLSGELHDSVTWSVPNGVAYARLRAAGESLYVLVWGRSAPWVTLGRVTEHGYESLREASSDIAGPLALPSGTVVARDGALEPLDGANGFAAHGVHVTCLGALDGLPYACTQGNLLRVDPTGLGASLFALTSVREPDYQTLPEAVRSDCTARWVDLRDHVASSLASSASDAGTPSTATPDAGVQTSSAKQPAGCSLGTGPEPTGWLGALLLLLCARRRTRASHRASRKTLVLEPYKSQGP